MGPERQGISVVIVVVAVEMVVVKALLAGTPARCRK